MKKIKYILLFFCLLLILAAAFFLWRIAPIANGYTAKYLCSHTFTSGLDPERALALYIKPMHLLFKGVVPEIDYEKKEVTSKYFGLFSARTAVWREGCGCTLLVKSTAEELHHKHHVPERWMAEDTLKYDTILWPEGHAVNRDSVSTSVDWNAIDRILDDAMKESADHPAKRNNTLALVIAWKGRIIGERYAEGVDEHTSLLGWSAAKSITSALTGVMVQEYDLDIYTPIDFPVWEKDERRGITIDYLLRMESGLDFAENYMPLADATEMLYGSADMGEFALEHEADAAPGTRWMYSSGTSNVLADVLYAEIGSTTESLHRLAYAEFFNRLGITTAIFEHDESDAFVGSSYLYMSARDWLRVCKLYMDDGIWNGAQILPPGWVTYSLTPTPNAPNASYGAHIWLNAAADPGDRRLPGLPADTYMFRGFQGQWIVGIPSKDLMVARLGVTHDDRGWSPNEVIVEVMGVLEGN